jgi:hypothetical protein
LVLETATILCTPPRPCGLLALYGKALDLGQNRAGFTKTWLESFYFILLVISHSVLLMCHILVVHLVPSFSK